MGLSVVRKVISEMTSLGTYMGEPAFGRGRVQVHDAGVWWLTVRAQRRVLVMAPTMTSVKRLLDIAALLRGDLRVQLVFTVPPNVFNAGAERMLRAHGAATVPWEQARSQRFDLAVTANLGHIEEIDAPVAVFQHGASRNPQARPRGRGSVPVVGPVHGFSPGDLIRGGMLVPTALALGHENQLALLEEGCPPALEVAYVVGDPCYDRLIALGGRRAAYRDALGLAAGEKLVVVTSTWRPNSLMGSALDVVHRLAADLPRPEYRVVLLTHPNIWAIHGSLQMNAWLEPATARGMVLTGPWTDWQPYLMAADWIVGDFGSVTLYGAATGVPVLLGAFPEQDVHPRGGAAALGAVAPRLSSSAPIEEQLHGAADGYDAAAMAQVASLISSEPGAFARHARRLLYRLMRLGEPATPARLPDPALPAALDNGPMGAVA